MALMKRRDNPPLHPPKTQPTLGPMIDDDPTLPPPTESKTQLSPGPFFKDDKSETYSSAEAGEDDSEGRSGGEKWTGTSMGDED